MALSDGELRRLMRACKKLPQGPDYRCDDYIENVLNSVLDFQMKTPAVTKAMEYFRNTHGARSHRKLRKLVDAFPNTNNGNRALAKYLWNNNHWSRAKFLRTLLECYEERGIRGQCSLRKWVLNADFQQDVKGKFRTKEHSIGFALFHWLQLRLGVDTVKPDVHIRNFVSDAIRRRATALEAVDGLKAVAKALGRKAYRLDAAIWNYQRDSASVLQRMAAGSRR